MEQMTPAILAGINLDRRCHERDEASLEELALLADTAGFQAKLKVLQHRDRIDPGWYIGVGQARQIRHLARENGAGAVLFDFELSPVQLRNLEKELKIRIITRTELILEIFARRARTKEAKLQVELATLNYALPRLRHMWPHLNRIVGGNRTRGPGEKQLEMDRRRLTARVSKIKKDLVSVRKHRVEIRKRRQYMNRVALVGYTNAGKSSLLNALAHASLHTESRLFATLDPATREVWLGDGVKALGTDTVGFIRRLPHTLVASFRSTLEEVKYADLLLHVVDVSCADAAGQIEAVQEVLREIGAHTMPVFYVFNKADLLNGRQVKLSLLHRYANHSLVSAKTGEGIDGLKSSLRSFFQELNAGRRPHLEEEYAPETVISLSD
jgi:GTP-binding protein HflX